MYSEEFSNASAFEISSINKIKFVYAIEMIE